MGAPSDVLEGYEVKEKETECKEEVKEKWYLKFWKRCCRHFSLWA